MTIAAEKPRVRVFLMTDYFARSKDYYLVAEDGNDAIEKRSHTTPTYIEEHDEKIESTEVQEEVAILVLIRVAPQPGQPQQVYLLPAYEAEEADAYHINADVITRRFRAEMAAYWREKEMIIFFASMAHHFSKHASHAVSRESVAALIPREKRAKLTQPLSQNAPKSARNSGSSSHLGKALL